MLSLAAIGSGLLSGTGIFDGIPKQVTPGLELSVVTLLIALFKIYYRSFRAAETNPAKALRYELVKEEYQYKAPIMRYNKMN